MTDQAMTTTAFTIDGYRIDRTHGVVRGIGIRYDANEIMNGVTEVFCYGTAVHVTRA
jgi:uncharacterized protein YbjQ (UPF0145 family)